jgi:hypothetical protein
LRDAKLQRANPRDEIALVITAAIPKTAFGALALPGGKRVRHLRFKSRLNERLNRRADKVLVPLQKLFDRDNFCLNLLHGHGLLPRQRVGDFDHHLHTMAASFDFAELSAHYPVTNQASW